MAYEVPSTDELQRRALDGLAAEFPTLRTTEGSEAYSESLARARLQADAHQRLGQLERNTTPATADERGLNQWRVALDVPRKGATKARGTQALQVYGTPASAVGLGQQLQHTPSQLLYQTTSAVVIGASGVGVLDLESIDTGLQTRLVAGDPLTILSPPPGIEQTAVLIKSLVDGGRDEESIGAWRDRQTRVWRDKRVAGSVSGYTVEATELPEIDRVFLYRRKPTAGSLSVTAHKEGTGTAKLLSASERQALEDALQDDMINDTVIALVVVPRIVHVDVVVSLLPGHARGFDANYTVAGWDPSTATLTVNEVLGADVGAGDLLTVESLDPDTSGASGKPVVIAAVTGASTMVLTPVDGVQPVLDFTPAPNDIVRPSSMALHAAWLAIRFGATDCATVPGMEQLGPANPAFKYGAWLSDIRVAEIELLAKTQAAIDDATAILSTANAIEQAVEFAFPDDDQVEGLFVGQLVVR